MFNVPKLKLWTNNKLLNGSIDHEDHEHTLEELFSFVDYLNPDNMQIVFGGS